MMSDTPTAAPQLKCINCGFQAPTGSDEWETATHPPLGTMTQCPECGSTNVHNQA